LLIFLPKKNEVSISLILFFLFFISTLIFIVSFCLLGI
jgi:hypothetical protein